MADTTYRVVLALETTGNLNSVASSADTVNTTLGRAHDNAYRLRYALVGAGEVASRTFHQLGSIMEGVADALIHISEKAALLAGTTLFGAATYGVAKLNNELEQTTISLGAIFQAQGFTDTFQQGFVAAGEQIAKMKQDVKTLPGDLGQLSNIMKMVATPAAMGGLGPDQIRQLAGRTMLVSQILGVDQAMAAREMANLLSGRAGAHNILGLRMGLTGDRAKEFNKESAESRVRDISGILDRYQFAADKFATSFVAIWTTLKDNIKYGFLADATSPLFESVKRTMTHINTWFAEHQGTTMTWANRFGQHLTKTWEMGVEMATRFGHSLENVGDRFFQLWDRALDKIHQLEPFFDRVAKFLEHVDLSSITKAASTIAELKFLGMGLHAAGGLVGTSSQMLSAAAMMRMDRGGGAALAATGPAGVVEGLEGAGAAGAAAGELGAAAGGGVVAAVALPVTMVAIGTAAAATLAAIGTGHALTDPSSPNHKNAVIAAKDMAQGLADVKEASTPVVNMFDRVGVALTEFTGVILQGIAAFTGGYNALPHPGANLDLPPDRSQYLPGGHDLGAAADVGLLRVGEGGTQFANAVAKGVKTALPGGGGGTNIQKVEIIVKGSDDPSRVARLTKEHLDRLGRNPLRSPFMRDWEHR